MAINATDQGGTFELVPAGTFAARCFSMVHIGTIIENVNGVQKAMNKVRISWELPTERKEFKEGEGEKPFVVSKEFTLSMNKKANLRKFLEAWRGKEFADEDAKKFDITKLIGKECMVSVVHKTSGKGNQYADITSASKLLKGVVCPAQENASFEFSYEPFSKEKFDSLPDWLKKKVETSDEYKKATQSDTGNTASKSFMPEEDVAF